MFGRKNNIIKKIGIVFGIFVLYMVLFYAIYTFIESINDNNLLFSIENIPKFVGMFIVSIGKGIIRYIYLVCIYAALVLASLSLYRSKLDETDFEKNKDYYRDILKNYSISVLNYIDKFKLEKKQSYTAKLLELQNKKIIEIEKDKIVILKKPTTEIDLEFINSIKNNKITMPLEEYEKLIVKEGVDKDLIVKIDEFGSLKNNRIIKYVYNSFAFLLIVTIILFFIDIFVENNGFLFTIEIVLSFLTGAVFIFMLIFSSSYSKKASKEQGYKRTKKGKEINLQLDGLKLFMEEFSNINNKESKHLVLWEDYLIYSVMFNINKKIQDDYSKYF